MKSSIVLIVILGLVGLSYRQEIKIMSEIRAIKTSFLSDAKAYGLNVREVPVLLVTPQDLASVLGPPPSGMQWGGICYKKSILINKVRWLEMSERLKQLTIYHELGHCALRMFHFDTFQDIMNWANPSDLQTLDWSDFKSKFFSRAQIESSRFTWSLNALR